MAKKTQFDNLVDVVAEDLAVSKVDARRLAKSVLTSIRTMVETGDPVRLPGFGRFYVKRREGYLSKKTPISEGGIFVPAKNVVKFKPYFEGLDSE